MSEKIWNIYLSGEIHSDWREKITEGVAEAGLPVRLSAPVTVHADSDDCAVRIFGAEEKKFWHDHAGALGSQVDKPGRNTIFPDRHLP